MSRTLALGCALFSVWLLWSGHFEPFLVSMGLLSTGIVLFLARRMGTIDEEGAPLHVSLRALIYLPWLLREIVKANLDVARRILDPRLPISPVMIRVKASQRTDLGRVIHANSITLTPGTVAVDLQGDTILVHALTAKAARETAEGAIDRKTRWVEGG